MSSDEVKVKFVADTTGLQGATVPNQIPAAGGGASSGGGKSGGGAGGGAGGGSGGGGGAGGASSGGGGSGGKPPPLPRRDRAAFPWESGWGTEFGKDLTAQFAGALSGINLLNTAFDVGKMAAEKYVEIIKIGVEYSQKIEKVSRFSGLSVEDVQKYGYAAQMSGVDFDTFANAMGNANKELGKLTLYGGTSIVALSKLQINVDSVKNHSVGAIDVLKKMADAYKKHAETAEMAALGNQLFGGSFKDMIPMLRNGSAEIERLASNAPVVNSQTISASAAFGRSHTQIGQTVGALSSEAASGYTSTESRLSREIADKVRKGEMTPEEARDALLNASNRGASRTIGNVGRYAGNAYLAGQNLLTGNWGAAIQNIGGVVGGVGAEAEKGEGIRGAGEDTKTVRARFLAMRGGKMENLSQADKDIMASFDKKIAEEGKMNLQSGIFQAASKMQQVGGGDVLSAISRVDIQEKIEDNTRRMADAMDRIRSNNPFGGDSNTPKPPDTNGPVAK